ncbi:MAG: RtcB family protein [Acidobacteria bacterium]|nr:RtcB family protein [Acidobacteriota bacterium]
MPIPNDIKKISDTVWEIPTTHKEGMRVPARIYATEKLLQEMDDGVYDQVTNVATLPGIVKYAYCMPDGHWGYGFPIGGLAAMDARSGVISPGGIGFDVNCLAGNTRVLTEHGAYREIGELEYDFQAHRVRCLRLTSNEVEAAPIALFLKKNADSKVYRITTEAGHEITATADHPFWTPQGMVPVAELIPGDRVAAFPFQGLPYEEPDDEIIVDEDDIRALALPFNHEAVMAELCKRNLLPLRRNDPRVPYLIKLLAYNMGDGSLTVTSGQGFVRFWGRREDLEDLRQDIATVGFKPSRVYERQRKHRIQTRYGEVKFECTEWSVQSKSRAFLALLHALGAPVGRKAEQEYEVPTWIRTGPKWHQRLFLAAYFGAEMSAPATMTGHDATFYMPSLSVNKVTGLEGAGRRLLQQMADLLEDFGVRTAEITTRDEYTNADGQTTVRVRLQLGGTPDSLLALYEKVGFEYHCEKRMLGHCAIQYLRVKEALLQRREEVAAQAVALKAAGVPTSGIYETLTGEETSWHFLRDSLYGRKTRPRIPQTFPGFEDFVAERTAGLGTSGMVWDRIARIEEIPSDEEVYDFTVNHEDHNFVANGLVVSNCGMRLVLTNLTYDEVKPHLRQLVDKLFQRVPAGVGSTGFVKISPDEFRHVVEQGARWCIKNGYGWQEDLERTEEGGCISGADATKISSKAVERGKGQIGTLGSGNHYLEIQVAKPEYVFDPELAKVFGIMIPNQVVVMFHCLPGQAKILTEHGYRIEIAELRDRWSRTKVKCLDFQSQEIEDTGIVKFFELDPCGKVFKITTATGKELVATEEHPVLTPSGLNLMRELVIGEKVAVAPFDGVDYEEPSDDIIVSEDDIRRIENNDKIINNLKKKGLLPLRMNSEKLPILVKLLGFLTGDGWLGRVNGRWVLKFIGDPEDLQEIRKDIQQLEYKATNSYAEECSSTVTFTDGQTRTISGQTNTIVIGSISLPVLLGALGAPMGSKSRNAFLVPDWLVKAPLWIKRLYLGAYFGAEMTRPEVRKKEPYRFGNPTISINKLERLKPNAYEFLNQIQKLLEELGVEVLKITEHAGVRTKSGEDTIKLRLKLSSKEPNLITLWSKIGYEYCRERKWLSAQVLQYLRLKNKLVQQEAVLTNKVPGRLSVTSYAFRAIPYPTFEEFRHMYELNPSTAVMWDSIESIEEIQDFNERVYDFTVAHPDHNFVANNFVTGNCGSRGFGHQCATDYLQVFLKVMESKYGIKILDRELACAPFHSPEGQDYFAAMKCAINMSFANRQVILRRIREVFSDVFHKDPADLGLRQVYDVAHNTAKLEKHQVDGEVRELLVHRKGATRAFGPGMEGIPEIYKESGQPVIIGGSMETGSYLLAGVESGDQTFYTTAHGSGRTMSRNKAKKMFHGKKLQQEMEARGIYVRTVSYAGLAEEAGPAYKNIDDVILATELAGISKRVVRFIPIGNVKG